MNRLIFYVLRGGVVLAVVLIAIGLFLGLLNPDALPRRPADPGSILSGLLQMSPVGFIALGVIVMMLTPVIRVLLSVMAYLIERDPMYVLITAIVFVNLMVGIVLYLG